MQERVFKEMLQQNLINRVEVVEAIPNKGKPAMNKSTTSTVWTVAIYIGDKDLVLESARGGAREWASLNSLDKWLRDAGISKYSIVHLAQAEQLNQLNLTFEKTRER